MSIDRITLKWGTLKGWNIESKKGKKLLDEYHKLGASMSVAMQKDTPRQKEIICELIDLCKDITNDWSGKKMTKKQAKVYVMNYSLT